MKFVIITLLSVSCCLEKAEGILCVRGLVWKDPCQPFKTCANPNGKETCQNCVCKDDTLIYDEDRMVCVNPDACPDPELNQKCKDRDIHSGYRNCQSSSCIATCKNPNPGPACSKDCRFGCFCVVGYVKNLKTGRCVLPSECP